MNIGLVAGQKRVSLLLRCCSLLFSALLLQKKWMRGFTVDLVLIARGNMQPDRADGLEDMTVAEMLKELLVDTMYEFTQWSQIPRRV